MCAGGASTHQPCQGHFQPPSHCSHLCSTQPLSAEFLSSRHLLLPSRPGFLDIAQHQKLVKLFCNYIPQTFSCSGSDRRERRKYGKPSKPGGCHGYEIVRPCLQVNAFSIVGKSVYYYMPLSGLTMSLALLRWPGFCQMWKPCSSQSSKTFFEKMCFVLTQFHCSCFYPE